MDPFLIISILTSVCILLVVGVYLIVHFQHPDDANEAYLPKVVVLVGFVLAGCSALSLPLDVANHEDCADPCGLPMREIWNAMFAAIAAFLLVVLPFTSFYYEADDGMIMAGTSVGGEYKSKFKQALQMEAMVLLIVLVVAPTSYFVLRTAEVPVVEYTSGLSIEENPTRYTDPVYTFSNVFLDDVANSVNSTLFENSTFTSMVLPFNRTMLEEVTREEIRNNNVVTMREGIVPLRVGPLTFFAALLSFVGWFFFAVFGGVGMASVPLELLLMYFRRPRHMSPLEFADAKESLKERVNQLVRTGELLKIERDNLIQHQMNQPPKSSFFNCFPARGVERKIKQQERKLFLEFRLAVLLMESDNQIFQDCTKNYEIYNPLFPYIALLCGLLSTILSILWLAQILLYILPPQPIHPFLNSFFLAVDGFFDIFGVLSVAVFVLYLHLCVVKGCFQVGLRIIFFTLHPMAPGKTYMTSFLFNLGLILLCTFPVVHFCADAFAGYARNAVVRQIVGTQMEYLPFFGFFFQHKIFVYLMLVVALLAAFYLYVCKSRMEDGRNSLALRDLLKMR